MKNTYSNKLRADNNYSSWQVKCAARLSFHYHPWRTG